MPIILGVFIAVILAFSLFGWEETNTQAPEVSTGTVNIEEESKPQENSAYTTCMSQAEYLKGADKERLIKACEKNKGQDASLAKNQEYAKKQKGDIVIWCRKGIREQLKQPSSADFRELDYYTSYKEIMYKTEVISKNDFNAEVRNVVTCTLEIKDGVPGDFSAKLDQ